MSRRILLVIDSLFALGDAYQLRNLIQRLSPQHAAAICVTGSVRDGDRVGFANIDVPIYFLASDQKLKSRRGAEKIQTGLRLRKRIRSFKPDIVHAFGQSATQIAAAVLIRNEKIKLVSSILSKWQPQTTLTEWFERCLLNRVDRFIFASESLQKEVAAFDVLDQKFSVVANSIEDNRVEDRKPLRKLLIETLGLEPSSFIAMTSADLEPRTRLKDLIWATDLLSCVRDDVHLVIFGEGSQHQRLLQFAACTAAADHIHFAGNPTSAIEMLGGADVFWNSHLDTPLPSHLLSAMNYGVPTVSVYGPETALLVKHQETSFAVNYGARDEFARWTKFLIEKPNDARRLGNQGRRHARLNFTANQMRVEIEKIYDGLDNNG